MTSSIDGASGTKLSRTSLRDQAVDALRAMVISGKIPAGNRINEAELAEQMGISRGPLREAIQRVSAEGLIEFRRNRGAFVREIAIDDIRLIYEVREVFESAAAKRAARVAGDDEIADVERQVAQVNTIVDSASANSRASLSRVLELNNDFHITILEICQNPYFLRYGNDLHVQLKIARLQSESSVERAREVVDEHQAVVDALVRRDAAAAGRAMGKHLKQSLLRFEEQMREHGA